MEAYLSLIPFLVVVFGAAMTGAFFMPGEWYRSLSKPTWTPPDWLFAPAWTVLYIMIAVAGWLVWQSEGLGTAIIVWSANIIFNAAWSWLMFGRRQIGTALLDALAMLLTIIAFVALTRSTTPVAALLFLPYLAWVAFASALNYSIFTMNPRPV
ncbi:MAG: TspO/MBR family protein [Pseudomonadota bacterium]